MAEPLFLSLHELGLQLCDPGVRRPVRATLVRRARRFADKYGLTVYQVDGHSFCLRAAVEALPGFEVHQ